MSNLLTEGSRFTCVSGFRFHHTGCLPALFRRAGVTAEPCTLYTRLPDRYFIFGGSLMDSTVPADLLKLKARLEDWRATRKYARQPIPDEFRQAAAEMATRYSPSLVRRILKLDPLKGSMVNTALVSKLELIDFYDRIAPRYGRVGPAVFAHLGRRLAELTGVADGSRVLDIAIGHGASLLPASELVGAGGLVIGVDLAAEMVKETHSELSRMGLQNVTVLRMDAEQLAFSEVTFDHLLCGFAIFFFPQPDRTLLEWSRVLRPGG